MRLCVEGRLHVCREWSLRTYVDNHDLCNSWPYLRSAAMFRLASYLTCDAIRSATPQPITLNIHHLTPAVILRAKAPYASPLKAISQLVLKNPSWDFDDLIAALDRQGVISKSCPFNKSVNSSTRRRVELNFDGLVCISALLEDHPAGFLIHWPQRCHFITLLPQPPCHQ